MNPDEKDYFNRIIPMLKDKIRTDRVFRTFLTAGASCGWNLIYAIAMIKKNSTKYTWKDSETNEELKLNVKEIYSRNKKRRGLSKYLLSGDVTVSDSDGNEIPAKLVYARNRNNRKDWVASASF